MYAIERQNSGIGPLVARVLMAIIFVAAGLSKLMAFGPTAGYIASQGIPLSQLVTAGTIALEIGGGIMLITGFQARLAAAALAFFTLVAAVLFHNFWAAEPDQFQNQLIHFQKNLAMVGGLLMVVLHGSGAYSLSRED